MSIPQESQEFIFRFDQQEQKSDIKYCFNRVVSVLLLSRGIEPKQGVEKKNKGLHHQMRQYRCCFDTQSHVKKVGKERDSFHSFEFIDKKEAHNFVSIGYKFMGVF